MKDATTILVIIGLIVFVIALAVNASNTAKAKEAKALAQSAAREDEAKANAAAKEARRQRLLSKYGDNETYQKIIGCTIWRGETAEQLRDSLGDPPDIDQKVLKTKKKEVWKYNHRGGNRYGVRITVENGVIVGWDEKQ